MTYPFKREDRLYKSESDVCRRQILTYKDGPCTERIQIFLVAIDPLPRYSNEMETATQDIYDDFLIEKNPSGLHGLYKNISPL